MRSGLLAAAALVASCSLWPAHVVSQAADTAPATANPLAPFERLIGGRWHLEGTYQEFEWGVGKRSVKSQSYFVIDGKPKLVAEGMWFWHPGEQQIKGVFTAIEMPVEYFDYTTRFEGNKMVNDLRSYDAKGVETVYVETWEFTDDTQFVWKLMTKTPDGLQEMMSGTFSKTEP
jgi:hypothetical protein